MRRILQSQVQKEVQLERLSRERARLSAEGRTAEEWEQHVYCDTVPSLAKVKNS